MYALAANDRTRWDDDDGDDHSEEQPYELNHSESSESGGVHRKL